MSRNAELSKMNTIKKVAHILLNEEVGITDYSPAVVSHPFTCTGWVMIREGRKQEVINICDSPENLKRWRRNTREAIDQADNVWSIFHMINKPYALLFVRAVYDALTPEEAASMLVKAWIATEFPSRDPELDRYSLADMFASCDPRYLMTAEELKKLDSLPEQVPIYRGVGSSQREHIYGLSWTLDLKKARWFACRFSPEGMVAQASVRKSDILAYLDGRGESEVIVDPDRLTDIAVLEGPAEVRSSDTPMVRNEIHMTNLS